MAAACCTQIPNNCEVRSPKNKTSQLPDWVHLRTIVQGARSPSFPAGSGTNNSSLSHPAASCTEQLFVLPAGISSRANKWCEQRAWQKLFRAAPTPNKSESPSPKARLVKPDDLRDTEHTKCKRYLWAFMLSCSISIGSLWVFVASFMRFWASV